MARRLLNRILAAHQRRPMILVHAALHPTESAAAPIPVPVERRQLAKRLWRATAADGTEFGFELAAPLPDGAVVHATASARYVVRQQPESVLVITLPTTPEAAAVTGWAVGNLHFPVEARPTCLLAPDDSALRQSLAHLGVPFRASEEVFRPHRFAAAAAPHSHGAAPADHPFLFKPVAPRP